MLNKEGQWIMATPVQGTIVVNIGDFMMRLCNDLYKSTVHRVYNRATAERISMPFFFGMFYYLFLPPPPFYSSSPIYNPREKH